MSITSPEKTVMRAIDDAKEGIINFLEDLVRIPSISGTAGEGKAQNLVIKKFKEIEDLGIDVWEPNTEELNKYPLHPLRSGPWSYEDRPNVVGTLKGTGGRSLILNGHVDVVSPEPIEAWRHDPWGAEIEDGRLYGRGSLDMKAGIVAMTYAIRCIQEAGLKLKGDVFLESVVEEEYGSGGTIATLVKGYKADAAIVVELSGADAICIGANGVRYFKVKMLGKPELPHLAHFGVNAIGLATKIYDGLMELDAHRGEILRGKEPLFETVRAGGMLGPGRSTNMTMGILKAGDWPATVAGWAELQGRIGFPPSEKGEDVMKQVEEAVKKVAEKDNWMSKHPPTVEWWGSRKEGYVLNTETPIAQTLKRNVEKVIDKSCELFAFPSTGDANIFVTRMGPYGGIPAVWYGPGGAQGHAADEYVLLNDVITVTKVLSLTILDWCGCEV